MLRRDLSGVARFARLASAALMLVVTACTSGGGPTAATGTVASTTPAPTDPPSMPATTTTTSTTAVATGSPAGTSMQRSPATTPPLPPGAPFGSSSSAVTAADLGATWHAGCPLDPSHLRLLHLSYWGFDNQAHDGTMVVNASVATAVTSAFRRLYDGRVPIHQMVPVSIYNGSDEASLEADNTAGFNCRYAVAPGTPHWSMHAYGEAIDVNPVENPDKTGSMILPPAGAAFLARSPYRPGMAVSGGQLVAAFSAIGWSWGGRWSSPDYQHFSTNGK